MKKIAVFALVLLAATPAFAHGLHNEIADEAAHAGHHGMELLFYLGIGLAVAIGAGVRFVKRGRRS